MGDGLLSKMAIMLQESIEQINHAYMIGVEFEYKETVRQFYYCGCFAGGLHRG